MRLTPMKIKNNTKTVKCEGFGGYNCTPACKESEFEAEENLSSRRHPALAPREINYTLERQCSDFYIYNDLFFNVVSGELYEGGRKLLTLSAETFAKREFSVVGTFLCIFPDGQYYDMRTDEAGSLGASFRGTCSFEDGTRFSVAAENNTLTCSGANFPTLFKVGDGVKISGSSKNDGYYVIREIEATKLVFDENVFEEEKDTADVKIEREIPNLNYTFECNNRLWGIYKNGIYASALGDPFNFYVFDGVSTDSYYKEVYSSGEFTGGISYGNTPVFFKEDMIYRIFGDIPVGFYTEMREAPGVSNGCHMSLAVVNGAVLYAGSDGIYSYDSSYPVKISQKLGMIKPGRACGGGDGEKYYISVSEFSGVYPSLPEMISALEDRKAYVYNTATKSWHVIANQQGITRIESGNYGSMNDKPNVFALDNGGRVFTLSDKLSGSASGIFFSDEYETVKSYGVSGEWRLGGMARLKYAVLSIELPLESRFSLEISFDGGEFVKAGTVVGGGGRKTVCLGMPPNRFSSFRLKYVAEGDFTLYSTELEFESSYRREK